MDLSFSKVVVFADGRVSDPMAKCIFLGWVGWDGM